MKKRSGCRKASAAFGSGRDFALFRCVEAVDPVGAVVVDKKMTELMDQVMGYA